MDENTSLYGESYYNHYADVPYLRTNPHWMEYFRFVAENIKVKLNPRTVLDAGCAKGFLVEMLRDQGIDARGIDSSNYAISEVFEPIRPYCEVGSIAASFSNNYDLIVCTEVVEHMKTAEASKAIKNICEHTDTVLFSSSPTDYSEATHINVQASEYWVREFSFHGFYRDLDFDAGFVASWAMLFRKRQINLPDLTFGYERNIARIKNENNDLRLKTIQLEAKLHDLESRNMLNEGGIEKQNEHLVEINRSLNSRVEQLQTEIAQKIAESTALANENREIRLSTSWKITHPIRLIKKIFVKERRDTKL